ncbi:AAA family ATPase [Vibrio methylphosphonaticus]|uniref:AAA family ATPase n=1 Tax=Vibrio methylphosphonaticus TaxID=2946866 RepID=UPI00202A375C|nr:chromosome partitioning protein ParA [Vibrio methylphosphonaticus]MCL9774996.1 chromosome partitioning protein ParA [Vibrio methylphosphonaticus]
MFDITKKLPEVETSKPDIPTRSGPTGCALIFQTKECQTLVEELFEFEGWDAPNSVDHHKVDSQFYAKQDSNLIIVELNESSSVVEDAEAIAATLPTHKGVVIIGQEDAISTLRALKGMGFYYVFWPINKYEFAEFVMHVHNDLKSYSGVSKERRAKRVAVVGSKGGIGTSYIATELSAKMAEDGVDTILVDHQYNDSNIDVLLGLADHTPRALDEFSVPLHELDLDGAINYLHPVSQDLRLLSLQGEASQDDLLAYNQTLCDLLTRNTNFIVEDFSGSVDFQVDCNLLVENYDVIAIVVEPSVAAVRKAKSLITNLDTIRDATHKRTRIITIVNHHRPDKSFVIQRDELEKYLGSSVDLDFNYCKNLPHLHVDGKRAYKHDRHVNQSIDQLVRLVNGRSANKSKGLLQRLGIR